MAKKKIHGLDLLRWVVYVLLALALGVFIYSFAWGFKNAKETALLGLQISADSQTATTKCAEGNMLYGIHNYPFSSVPKEAGAHSKYLDKMPGGNWKCSNICAPSDVNKFADTLSGLTVGGQKMNVVGSRSEFDALVAKSSGKNELLERTMILDVSLQRRGKGCFGPSDDYDNLKGATLAKENTTAEDQRKAEEERQKKAQAVTSGGTGSSGRTSRTEPSAGTAAGDPSVQTFKAATATGSNYKELEKCTQKVKTILNDEFGTDSAAALTFLRNEGLNGDVVKLTNDYYKKYQKNSLKDLNTKEVDEGLNFCKNLESKITEAIARNALNSGEKNSEKNKKEIKKTNTEEEYLKYGNAYIDQSSTKLIKYDNSAPLYIQVAVVKKSLSKFIVFADRITYKKYSGGDFKVRITRKMMEQIDDDDCLIVYANTNGGIGSYSRESTTVICKRVEKDITTINKGLSLIKQSPSGFFGNGESLKINLVTSKIIGRVNKIKDLEYYSNKQREYLQSYGFTPFSPTFINKALKDSKVYTIKESSSAEDIERVVERFWG